jgi:hypothetical protein
MTAPAPSRSSKHGRNEPSGRRSPQAITPTERAELFSHAATADAFRKHDATTAVPASSASAAQVEPFGEGSTTASPAPSRRRLKGDSDGPNGSDSSASTAPTEEPKAAAERSRHR